MTTHTARTAVPVSIQHAPVFRMASVLVGAVAIAASAQIAFPLPFTPVPVTAQTLAVLLVAGLLGRNLGVASVLTYLWAGFLGAPVFASGIAGPAVLALPSMGYLVGFVPAAWLAGSLADRGVGRSFAGSLAIMTAGTVVILAIGTAWLATWFAAAGNREAFLGTEASTALAAAVAAGLLPFIPGAVIKIGLGAAFLPSLSGPSSRRRG